MKQELGTLDPNWFEILTSQAFTKEEEDELSVHQDGHFKMPLDKSALDSQFFSTPKVLRQNKALSPEHEHESSFTSEQDKSTLPWKAASPYLFGTNKSFVIPREFLNTPQKSPISFARHISESLGAQIHPDISWTSSLNTPPAHQSVQSTMILSKPEDSPHPVSPSADNNVIFVRKLFPSLSNVSGAAGSSQYQEGPTAQQDVGSPEAGQRRNCHNSPESSQIQSNGVWRQTLPDAIDGRELRSAVASVLDGAETALSIFFSNSSSALRRVKTDSRKRKQSHSTVENNCDSTERSPTRNVGTSDQRTNDQDPGGASSSQQFRSPTKTKAVEVTQWSPLSLSDLSHCTVDASCREGDANKQQEINVAKEKLASGTDSAQQLGAAVSKKKRLFVYKVQSSKPKVQEEDVQVQKKTGQEMKVQQVRTPTGEEEHHSSNKETFEPEIVKLGNVAEDNLPLPVQAESQDLDMSLLCRAFAQELTQLPDLSKPSKQAEDATQKDFCPSACLSALKQAKQKSGQQRTNLDRDFSVSSRAHMSSTDLTSSVIEGTSDSGFQSAVAGTTQLPVSDFFPSTEKDDQSQQRPDRKAVTQGKGRCDDIMQDNEANTKSCVVEESQTVSLPESELHTETTSTLQWSDTKAVDNNMKGVPLRVRVDETVPQQTVAPLPSVHTAGFQTASNKCIKISSANMEKARRLLEETEGQSASAGQSSERCPATKDQSGMTCASTKTTISTSNHPPPSSERVQANQSFLTPSQTADVTELCSLLEQADSQFEFTEFKPAKADQQCEEKAEEKAASPTQKDLDPDSLMGIDFDDSFNLTPGLMSSVSQSRTNCEKPPVTRTSSDNSSGDEFNKEKAPGGDGASSSRTTVPAEAVNCDTADKCENKNPLLSAGGFQTAGGNALRLSKTCLSKARALFADLEDMEDITNREQPQNSPKHHNTETHGEIEDRHSLGKNTGKVLHRKDDKSEYRSNDKGQPGDRVGSGGFRSASGKGIDISAKAMQQANAFFRECDDTSRDVGASVKHQRFTSPLIRSVDIIGKKTPGVKGNICEERVGGSSEVKDVNVGSSADEVKELNVEVHTARYQNTTSNTASLHGTPSAAAAKPLPLPSCTSNRVGGGFSTASGKRVFVSPDAMAKAKFVLDETDPFEGQIKQQHNQKDNSKTGPQTRLIKASPAQNDCFHTAGGRGISVPPAALTEAKALWSECDRAESRKETKPTTKEGINAPLTKNNDCFGSSVMEEMSSGGGFCTAAGRKVCVSADAMSKAKHLLNQVDSVEEQSKQQNHPTGLMKASPPQHGGFQTAGGRGVTVSSAALQKAKALLSEREGAQGENPTTKPPIHDPPHRSGVMDGAGSGGGGGGGFSTASGKKVCVSAEAMTKAKHLLSVSDGDPNRPLGPTGPNQALSPQNGGFHSASGKAVAVSATALSKAKALFSQSVEDENRMKPTTSAPVNAGTSSSYGFAAASGKKLAAFSAEALQKNKSPSSTEIPSVSGTTEAGTCGVAKRDDLKNNAKITIPCAFTTAGGAKVHVSEKSLSKAKNLLKESAGEELPDSNIITESSTRSVNAPHPDRSINQNGASSSETEESTLLKLQPLHLDDCTDTQQMFVAQEALDCANALLEDEDRAGRTLSMTSDPESNRASVEEQKGKRWLERTDTTGQPPPKRRLLEEFVRTVDGPRGSTLQPQKSCPDGVMNDRRVFKYSASLHPNVSRPHRDGKNYVVTRLQKTTLTPTSATEEVGSSHSKTAGFVPPFLKNVKTESRQDNTRTPPAFVPPFKKQRQTVQESSLKPQKDQDEYRHRSQSNAYVPPFKKTQNITEITGNKSREDIQTSGGAADGELKQGQDLDSGYGAKDSSAEASGVESRLSPSQGVVPNLQSVELARDMQDMRIRKKKRQTIRPLPGSLFLTKTSGVSRVSLRAAVNGRPPARYAQQQLYGHGVHHRVSQVTSESSESFRFNLLQFFKQEAFTDDGGVKLADGGWLVPRRDGTAGKEEFYRALCDTPGVDPKLISEEWVYNHYRWIVWKQASMERSFPATMGSLCLTPEQVLLQLKYRYDVEVDHSRRPALRRIMEKDDTPAKTLVLCVCGVVTRDDAKNAQAADSKGENPAAVIWLTDGWYAIKAQMDGPLTAMLHKGRLAVGGKLIVHGAELVGSKDACSPLEAPESIMLKICANSSRPARWDAKLGFHRDPRPFLLPVSSLYSNGGPVGCVDVVLLRSYPTQWMERKADGGVVFRSTRAEEKEARRYDSHKQKAMENLFAKVQAEVEKEEKGNNKPQRRRRTLSRQDIVSLQDGEELHDAVGDDLAYLEARLSEQQMETLGAYRRSVMEKRQAELQHRYRCALEQAEDEGGSCPKRDVTPVWRLCVADSMNQSGNIVYQLNIWRPSPDLQSLLKEGYRYKVYNIATSDGKKRCRSTALQLTATKKTQFQDIQASQEWLSARFQPRVSANFVDLQTPDFQPLCGEVDLTGYVVSVVDGQGPSPAFYLADGDLNFVKVRCFSSLAQSGLEEVVKPQTLLALSNLQLRAQPSAPIPLLYAGDLTLFSTNPKEMHLQGFFSQLRNMVQDQENFYSMAEERLSRLVRPDGPNSFSSPAPQPQTPGYRSDRKQDTNSCVTAQQPIRSCGSFTPVNARPPPTNSSAEKDPKTLKRRRALDYLSRIPSPPPLSQLGTTASPCINKTFNPPRRSGTPSTLNTVRTPAPKRAPPVEDEWVNDEELAMIDTQALLHGDVGKLTR
ncbi:breast cancer type 2 susceptibility protein [Genypterus blacodes]|uniref:breast cancer type 2 susceptibility protein n=1 Tax=Genypterus blacodes TaxID=154954 RepID=UPI003F7678A3